MRYYYDGTADDADEESGREGSDDDESTALRDGHDDGEDDDDGERDDPDDADDDDPDLDADFPRGDGTADTAAVAYCPYCGELNELAVDPGGGSSQSYVEDCHVCCRPWRVTVAFDREGQAVVQLDAADE